MAPSGKAGGVDDAGQMMILAAVVLLIGFIALAGMVARVSQLGSQTTIESEQAILQEVGPLADSMDTAVCRLKPSATNAFTNATTWTVGNPVITGTGFKAAQVGMTVSGTGIPPGTRVVLFNSATSLTLSNAPTSGTGAGLRFTPCLSQGTTTTFDLNGTTSPTLEAAIVGVMEHLQSLMASRGLFMDWSLGCVGGDADLGQVTAQLWDGTVWVQVKSSVAFPRDAC